MSEKPNPETLLTELKQHATARKQKSLDIIHAICKEQHARGSKDFSIATIGRLSQERGGPTTQAIRNKDGECYRTLLTAWVSHVDGLTRKPPIRPEPGVAEDLLGMIADPAVRAVVGVVLAENRKLKGENNLLKRHATVVVDRRPEPAPPAGDRQQSGQVLPAMDNLMPLEVEALQQALSGDFLKRMGWEVDERTGRVSKAGVTIFKPGFATAIRKVIEGYGKG